MRDDRGDIIYSACRELRTCNNALEAELATCREGLELALYRTNLPIMVAMDNTEAVAMLTGRQRDRSVHRALVGEIRSMASLATREISFIHCSRSQNIVSHELATYGRNTPRTAVWLAAGMNFVVNLVAAEKHPCA